MSDALSLKSEVTERTNRRHVEAFAEVSRQLWSERVSLKASEKKGEVGLPTLELTSADSAIVHRVERPKPTASESLTAERAQLLHLLDQAFGKETSRSFRDELHQFEVRAWKDRISKSEIAETYKQVCRILAAHGDSPLTPRLRKQVAREVLLHCALPEVISQGEHNTCNVTAIEVRTFYLHPAKAAKLVADIATTGEYTTASGIKIKLDKVSMKPDHEALDSKPTKGEREYATQLFNLAAVNIWYAAVKPGMRYEQRIKCIAGDETVEEMINDYSSGKPVRVVDPISKKPLDSPYLSADQIAFISDAIVGKHEPYAVLAFGQKTLSLPGEKLPSVHAADIIDEPHLPGLLQSLKSHHQLPAIAAVDTNVDPLNADSGSSMYGSGGGHVINVTDFVGGQKPRVSLDNEWSVRNDHPNNDVDMHDLYLCMGGARVARLDAFVNVDEAHKAGKSVPVDELRLLQYNRETPLVSNYSDEAVVTINRLANSERRLAGAQRTQWLQAMHTVVNTVPAADKVRVLSTIQSTNVCSSEELGSLIVGAARSVSFNKQRAIESNDKPAKQTCIRASREIAEYIINLPGEVKLHYFKQMRGQ